MPIAKSKSSELLDRLQHYLALVEPDEFGLKRLEQDARRQITTGVDVADAYGVLGGIAYLRDDEAAFRSAFRTSFRLAPMAIEMRLNYSGLLLSQLHMDEACECAEVALDDFPSDPLVLSHGMEVGMTSGRIHIAERAYARAVSLKVEDSVSIGRLFAMPQFEQFIGRMDDGARAALTESMDVVSEVVKARHSKIVGWVGDVTHDGVLVSMLTVDADVEALAETNALIADALVARDLDFLASFATLSCIKASHDSYA